MSLPRPAAGGESCKQDSGITHNAGGYFCYWNLRDMEREK